MITATATTAETAGSADATLLRLIWLASPALPVGGFSYSEGLESAVEHGLVGNEAQAGDWLLDQLLLGQARADWAVAAAAHAAWQASDTAELQRLNEWVVVTRESMEWRAQTEQTGRSLLEWLRNSPQAADPRVAMLADLAPAPTWPLAFALATVLAGAAPRDALLAMAFGWAENMAQSAIKAVPLGQAAAQRLLGRLVEAIPGAVDLALQLDEPMRQAHAPMLAILSARHEVQYSRLFRS
ncbi:urease accessory protein UreF [Piscinibacter sakaiensis]|uniref:urease accessory protein UreF n=1 Tax=Piscinibacter sakaiensis TaxID=1547922 RepID=UPI003AAB4FB4